jgi:hypothetical protein
MITDVWTWFWFRARLDRLHYWVLQGIRQVGAWRRRRQSPGDFADPWVEQRSRPGLWVAIADAARKGG